MEQPIQIAGAILILTAFIAAQRGVMSPQSLVYLWLNLVGSVVLAVLAAIDSDWGFLLLEGVWAIVSAWGLLAALRGREPVAPGH
ncbi:MAG TPA: hypothetical protein VKA36_10670 [Solirubrobacterales bacterium]|nr:hypothetical protein [Solirubrobacterales bacterium]